MLPSAFFRQMAAAAGRGRAPSGTFRSTDMSKKAHVMTLSRRQCPAACFLRLVRPATRKKCQFGAKVLACCCCCLRTAPSGTFRRVDMRIEAHAKRLCREQCYAACFWRLLRLITLENDDFTRKISHMWLWLLPWQRGAGAAAGKLERDTSPEDLAVRGRGSRAGVGGGSVWDSCHCSMYIRSMTLSFSHTFSLSLSQAFVHPCNHPLTNHSPTHSFYFSLSYFISLSLSVVYVRAFVRVPLSFLLSLSPLHSLSGFVSVSLFLFYTHTRAHAVTRSLLSTHSQTHTRTKSLSPSFSLTHTHFSLFLSLPLL